MQFPDPVTVAEPLSRYLLEKTKFSSENRRVKFSAFMPANDNILSVFRTCDLSKEEIIELGETYVARPQNRTVLAYAVIVADEFIKSGLTLTATAEPHPRHVDVEGWTESVLNKARAHVLAEIARLELK